MGEPGPIQHVPSTSSPSCFTPSDIRTAQSQNPTKRPAWITGSSFQSLCVSSVARGASVGRHAGESAALMTSRWSLLQPVENYFLPSSQWGLLRFASHGFCSFIHLFRLLGEAQWNAAPVCLNTTEHRMATNIIQYYKFAFINNIPLDMLCLHTHDLHCLKVINNTFFALIKICRLKMFIFGNLV